MRINKTRNVWVGTSTTRKRIVEVEQAFLAIILSVVHLFSFYYLESMNPFRISRSNRKL